MQLRNPYLHGIYRALIFVTVCHTDPSTAQTVTGKWQTVDEDGYRDSIVEITQNQDVVEGHVRWLLFETYPESDPMHGQPLVDRENPDPTMRQRPVLGLKVLSNFEFNGEYWVNGQIYSVRTGKSYKARMHLKSPNALAIRGYIGSPIFGKTVTWSRVEELPESNSP